MVDARSTTKLSWFRGSQTEWDDLVGPFLKVWDALDGAESDATPAPKGDSAMADDLFTSVASGEGWKERLAELDGAFETVVANSEGDMRKLNALRFMSDITPAGSRFLFAATLGREGREDVRVPNLPAILSGIVPAHLHGKDAFAAALEAIGNQWYGGNFHSFARDVGANDFDLNALVSGKAKPREHAEVAEIANRIGIDPDLLDVLWFADENKWEVSQFLFDLDSPMSRQNRARLMSHIASMRAGDKYRRRDSGQSSMRHYLDMAAFAMRSRIHPKTVIPVVAGIEAGAAGAFDAVLPFAEELALSNRPWKAAVACYLAADFTGVQGEIVDMEDHLKTVTALVMQGNYYLKHSVGTFPDFLSPEHAAELRLAYLNRGLELHNAVEAQRGPGIAKQGGARLKLVKDITGAIEELGGTVPAQDFGGAMRAEPNFESSIERMTDERLEVIDEFKRSYADVWERIRQAGRADIVEDVFDTVDRGTGAISFMAFNTILMKRLKGEGVIPADYGSARTVAENIDMGMKIMGGLTFAQLMAMSGRTFVR